MPPRERPKSSASAGLVSFTDSTADVNTAPVPRPRSKAFSSVLHQLDRFVRDDSITIVFEGESGTGKNWLARLAHHRSSRSGRPLHEISLATVTDSLASSELFGHVPGAFTDARGSRAGAFQSANQSTLFLDEIGKATPEVQRLLLRAIEDRVICPVGADRPVTLDVRLLAATNADLNALVATNRFLPDLYARLGWFRIRLPALRERPEDIPDLAHYFLARHARRCGYPPGLPTIHPALMAALQGARWESNLRELDGAIHRLLIESDSAAELTFDHCVDSLEFLRVHTRGRPTKSSRASVAATVKRSDSIADAARALSMSRSTVYRKLAQCANEPLPPPVAD
jgi:two-component system, NtrC family, response regulator HydG